MFKYCVAIFCVLAMIYTIVCIVGWIQLMITDDPKIYNYLEKIGLPPFKNGIK